MSIRKNTFRFNQSALKNEMDKDRHLSNRLNKWDDIKDVMKEHVFNSIEKELSDDKKINGFIITNIIMLLCSFGKIGLWRPNTDSGKPTKDVNKTLLNEQDMERLDAGKGISMHRLFLIAYGIAKKAVKNFDELNRANVAEITDETFLKLAREYHNEKALARKNRQAKKKDSEKEEKDSLIVEHEEVGEITVDSILDGETSLSDVNDIKLLDEAYQLAESSGKKAAITRQKNKIKA